MQEATVLRRRIVSDIYGLEEAGAQWFLVLELVAGDTLAARIGRGPLPLGEAVARSGDERGLEPDEENEMTDTAGTERRPGRRVRYGVAMSLDGYIAGPNGESDWIVHDPDIDFAEIFSRFDTLLIGRKTFEAMSKMEGGGGAWPGVTSFVISRTMKKADHPDVTIVRDAGALIAGLRARDGKDIWLFGGGELFRSLLDAGLVDGIDAAIVPVLLGSGIPLLPSSAGRTRLALRSRRVYERSGIVALEYDVARG